MPVNDNSYLTEIVTSGMGICLPDVQLKGGTLTYKPPAVIRCQVERNAEDSRTTVSNLRLFLCLLGSDNEEEDDLEIDLTLEASLQSLHQLFDNDFFPVQLLICQPDEECVGAIIAHAVAEKIGHLVTVEEERHNNEVRFTVDFGKGQTREALVKRDVVAKVFHWEPLNLLEQIL